MSCLPVQGVCKAAGMKWFCVVSLWWVVLVSVGWGEAAYPAAVLDNGSLRIVVDLADTEDGRYQGTRFDLSGQMLSARYGGMEFFGPWKGSWDGPVFRDGAGPAEEFSMENPPGYAEAGVGGEFLKIGVGVLRRTDARSYLFHREYPVVSRGEWENRWGALWVESEHRLEMGTDWGYRYVKRVELDAEKAEILIRRRLWNTGKRRIETEHYSHNFVLPGDFVPDERIEMETGILIEPAETVKEAIVFDGRRIGFREPMPKGGHYVDLFALAGIEWRLPARYNRGLWRNRERGVELSFAGSHPLSKLVFYGLGRSLSLEPFVPIEVEPGEVVEWQTVYRFRGAGGEEGSAGDAGKP